MAKYEEIGDHGDITNMSNGFYKTKSHRIFNFNGLTLFINRDKDDRRSWYYVDFSHSYMYGHSYLSKEEFRIQLKIRNTRVWKSMYGMEE